MDHRDFSSPRSCVWSLQVGLLRIASRRCCLIRLVRASRATPAKDTPPGTPESLGKRTKRMDRVTGPKHGVQKAIGMVANTSSPTASVEEQVPKRYRAIHENEDDDAKTCTDHHHHHHHQFLNREGRWGTTDDFATSFLHSSLFSTALWDLPNSRPVHPCTDSMYG